MLFSCLLLNFINDCAMAKKRSSREIMTQCPRNFPKAVRIRVTTCHDMNHLRLFTALHKLTNFGVLLKYINYVSTSGY